MIRPTRKQSAPILNFMTPCNFNLRHLWCLKCNPGYLPRRLTVTIMPASLGFILSTIIRGCKSPERAGNFHHWQPGTVWIHHSAELPIWRHLAHPLQLSFGVFVRPLIADAVGWVPARACARCRCRRLSHRGSDAFAGRVRSAGMMRCRHTTR